MKKNYQNWIIEELESWRHTFINLDEGEDSNESDVYIFLSKLIDKYLNSECSKEDYENILFHLWQSKSE